MADERVESDETGLSEEDRLEGQWFDAVTEWKYRAADYEGAIADGSAWLRVVKAVERRLKRGGGAGMTKTMMFNPRKVASGGP